MFDFSAEIASIATAETLPAFQRNAMILREAIINGRLQAGQALAEQELGAALHCSRNTLREALRFLQGEGLVEYVRNHGVCVRQLGHTDVRDIYTARRHLETLALRTLATSDGDHLVWMQHQLDAATSAAAEDRWQAVGTCSLRFHQCIVSGLGSARIDEFFSVLMAQQRLLFATGQYESEFQRPWLVRDRALWTLLATGAIEEACQALASYLAVSEQGIMRSLSLSHFSSGV